MVGASEAQQVVFLEKKVEDLNEVINERNKHIRMLQGQIDAYRAALTPSSETKAAYIGEVKFKQDYTDENGEEHIESILVPWTSMKEFMALVRGYAKAKMKEWQW